MVILDNNSYIRVNVFAPKMIWDEDRACFTSTYGDLVCDAIFKVDGSKTHTENIYLIYEAMYSEYPLNYAIRTCACDVFGARYYCYKEDWQSFDENHEYLPINDLTLR